MAAASREFHSCMVRIQSYFDRRVSLYRYYGSWRQTCLVCFGTLIFLARNPSPLISSRISPTAPHIAKVPGLLYTAPMALSLSKNRPVKQVSRIFILYYTSPLKEQNYSLVLKKLFQFFNGYINRLFNSHYCAVIHYRNLLIRVTAEIV